MITQTVRKQLFCETDVRAIGKFIPRELLCVIGVHRTYLMESHVRWGQIWFSKLLMNQPCFGLDCGERY